MRAPLTVSRVSRDGKRYTTREHVPGDRSGAAAVEFAIIAPLFLTLVLGTLEIGNAISKSHDLHVAVRGAGRLAAMDFQDKLAPGQSGNAKVISDVKAVLSASGVPGNDVDVAITHSGGANDGAPFDLEDENNYLKLFKITASVPYSSVGSFPMRYMKDKTLTASITLRLARSRIVQ